MSAGLTFLFTDIEGSTQLVEELGSGYSLALRVHRSVLNACFDRCGGKEFGSEGDALFAVFSKRADALTCAIDAQRRIEGYAWPEGARLRVRIGVTTGPARISGGEYVGVPVHEAARVCAAAHGGQILCSTDLEAPADGHPPEGTFRDLGTYHLRGIAGPRRLLQLTVPDLDQDFPPPREALRDGGARVTIWRRENPTRAQTPKQVAAAAEPVIVALDGSVLEGGVEVEVRRASSGADGAFRLIVRCDGRVEEEFDGLTVGGATDAAAIVNAHSRFVRIADT
ncbi:MAG TPA: adenylate/guanylate cyclase domain-containing protein [Acidimicrobiales bacterium]|nr:adenylate/guanylate cyclase domain-containing protein [Acidimicrobiales bacterium]